MNRGYAEDINDQRPITSIGIQRVGVVGVRTPICILINEQPVCCTGEFELSVGLSSQYRAVHMSRHIEALHDALCLDSDRGFPLRPLLPHDICQRLVDELLRRHDYACSADASVKFEYFVDRLSPTRQRKHPEPYWVELSGHAARRDADIDTNHSMCIEAVGISTCPCAQNYLRHELARALPLIEGNPQNPGATEALIPTHMQRAIAMVQLSGTHDFPMSLDELILLTEEQMSGRTHALLKRDDEAHTIREALQQPKFVEDIARDIVGALLDVPGIRDETRVTVSVETQESIHKHNAYARIDSHIGLLRTERQTLVDL